MAIQEDHIREAGPLEREFSDSGTRALGTGDDVGLGAAEKKICPEFPFLVAPKVLKFEP